MRRVSVALVVLWLGLTGLLTPAVAEAQVLGTFRWRMEPYCNTFTLTVTQEGGGFRLQGTEDLCDPVYFPEPVEGSAFINTDGQAVLGLNTGNAGGFSFEGTRVVATINPVTFNGVWRDDAGRSGTLLYVTTASTPGTQRGEWPKTFLHQVSSLNRPSAGSNISCFSHPMTNGNSSALIVFSQNRGRQTSIRPLVNSSVSLYYDDDGTGLPAPLNVNVWCLSRDDSAPMPDFAGFTIRIVQ